MSVIDWEKLAASRGMKELRKLFPEEFTKSVNARFNLADLLNSSKRVQELPPKKLKLVSDIHGTEAGHARLRAQVRGLRALPPTAEIDAQQRRRLRDAFSGAHAPKDDEILLPAGMTGEHTYNVWPKGDTLFRGNPLPFSTNNGMAFTSKHPDVAAAYSLGRVDGLTTQPTKHIFAYSGVPDEAIRVTRGADNATPLVPDDRYNAAAEMSIKTKSRLSNIRTRATVESTEQELNKSRRSPALLRRILTTGSNNPTYETVVNKSKMPRQPTAVYTSRLSRTPEGDPAYALKLVEGVDVLPKNS